MIKCRRIFFLLFFFPQTCKESSKVLQLHVYPSNSSQATLQQQFTRGDSSLQETPERAPISGGDLRNVELWTAGIQSGAIRAVSYGDAQTCGWWGVGAGGWGGSICNTDMLHTVVVHRLLFLFFLQTLVFLLPRSTNLLNLNCCLQS